MRTGLKKELKEEILGNAFAYLVKTGLERVSVRELGKCLRGGSFSTLYTYFDDKDDCLIEATRYGLYIVSGRIFAFARENFMDLDVLFAGLLDEVDKWKADLRFVYQMAVSPVYGEKTRAMNEEGERANAEEIQKLADIAGCSAEEITSVIYNIIAVILGYVIWDSRALAEAQMRDLQCTLERRLGRAHEIRTGE